MNHKAHRSGGPQSPPTTGAGTQTAGWATWPAELSPQAQREPFVFRATEWLSPPAITDLLRAAPCRKL